MQCSECSQTDLKKEKERKKGEKGTMSQEIWMDISFFFWNIFFLLIIYDGRNGELSLVVTDEVILWRYYSFLLFPSSFSSSSFPSSSPSPSPSPSYSSSSPKRLLHFIILLRIKNPSIMYTCHLCMNALSFIHPIFFSLYLISCTGSQWSLPSQGLIAPRLSLSPLPPCHGPIPRVAQKEETVKPTQKQK